MRPIYKSGKEPKWSYFIPKDRPASQEIVEAAKAAMALHDIELAIEIIKGTDLSIYSCVGYFSTTYGVILYTISFENVTHVLTRNVTTTTSLCNISTTATNSCTYSVNAQGTIIISSI